MEDRAVPHDCPTASAVSRRQWLGAMLAGWTCADAQAEPATGWLRPPQSAPAIAVQDVQGRHVALPDLLSGHLTAVQLMFTGCTSTCGVQGALFSEMARRTAVPGSQVRWLSISIDALGDDAARLAAWQQRFGAHPSWTAAVPGIRQVDTLAGFLRGGQPRSGTHTNQVFVFDTGARLVYRTGDDPSPDVLLSLLQHLHPRPKGPVPG